MSTTTMLELVQQATGEMGLAIPSTVVGNANTDVTQIYRLINGCGYELLRKYDWQALLTEYRFTTVTYTYTGTLSTSSTTVTGMSSVTGLTTNPSYFQVAGTGIPQDCYLTAADAGLSTVTLNQIPTASGSQSLTFTQTKYAFATDFDRLVDRTEWDKSQHWEMLGPETQQQVQWLKSGFISTGPRVRYYPAQNLFQIWPPIGAAHYLGYVYVSKNWAASTVGVGKSSFTADTDTCIFNDRLMVLFLKMKYFATKGFSIGDANTPGTMAYDFEAELSIAKANDAGSPTLSMNPEVADILLSWDSIPDSGYGA